MKTKQVLLLALLALFTLHFALPIASAQGTAFTYQGQLQNNGSRATGSYDLTFAVFTDSNGVNQVGGTLTNTAAGITNGLFTVVLDFGPGIFTGPPLWLQIGVETNGGVGVFTLLTPLQPLTPTPYAIYAENSASVNNASISASQLNTVGAPASGQVLAYNGASLVWSNQAAGGGNSWSLTGNAGTSPANGNFLGTTDNNPLELHVNGGRGWQLAPTTDTPNVIGGAPGNYVAAGVQGATIGGGGTIATYGRPYTNSIFAFHGTIGGGLGNTIQANAIESTVAGGNQNAILNGANDSAIGGGYENQVSEYSSTIGGGYQNNVSGAYSTIGGGYDNQASENWSTIGGGYDNQASGVYSTIGGGFQNNAGGSGSFSGGGYNNQASGYVSSIGGGYDNQANNYSSIGGGYDNQASGVYSTIGGGNQNNVSGIGSFIGGGGTDGSDYAGNSINDDGATIGGGLGNSIPSGGTYAFIGGGYDNQAGGGYSSIGGGYDNQASGYYSIIGGGYDNQVSEYWSTIGGGNQNNVSGAYSTIGGGYQNNVSGSASFIGGGYNNQASGYDSSIGGGADNQANNYSSIGGGYDNQASGVYSTIGGGISNQASAFYASVGGGSNNVISPAGVGAVIPGGAGNTAKGVCSMSAGQNAAANDNNSFVWGDGSRAAASQGANSFSILATGGVWFFTGPYPDGLHLAANGSSWGSPSDRNAKKNFQPVNALSVLEKLAAIPVQQWNYKWEKDSDVPNIGPMAQDFKAAFYPGRDDKSITTLEFDGVELAAIQGLNQKLEAETKEKDAEIQDLKQSVAELKKMVQLLAERK